jgi:hypothetical protein
MYHQGPQAAVDTVNVQDTRTETGENLGAGVFDDRSRPTNPYSAGQYQHALQLRQRSLSRTPRNYANNNGSASLSGTRDPDYRDARGRAPHGNTSSTPADSAPDVPDEEFLLIQQHDGNAATKRDPESPKRISEHPQVRIHMSAEVSAMKPTILQDVHLALIRLRKRYRVTERAAQELIS